MILLTSHDPSSSLIFFTKVIAIELLNLVDVFASHAQAVLDHEFRQLLAIDEYDFHVQASNCLFGSI